MNTTHLAFRFTLALVAVPLAASELGSFQPKNGDIVFQSLGGSPLTDMIESSTRSDFSHCGIVVQENGQWKVLEAIGPVCKTPLEQWIQRGRHDGFAAYRLKAPYAAKTDAIVQAAKLYLGAPYDIRYDLDEEKIYCSELVFKAFRKAVGEDLGRIVKLKDLNWQPNVALIRKMEGGTVPLELEIITPVNLSQANQLECVFTRDISANRKSK